MNAWLQEQLVHHAPSAIVLTGFVLSIAYVHSGRVKTLIYSLPVPFSCAYLATRLPINATHITGLVLVVGYNWLVYVLVEKLRVPLLIAITVSALSYFAGGMLLRPVAAVPLLLVAGLAMVAWAIGVLLYHPKPGVDHRSRSPWWIKAPAIFVIAMCIYNATHLLAGAVGLFPYAGVFTSYEMRHSLRTLAGQFTINSIGIFLCLLTIAAAQPHMPAPAALLLGWLPVIACVGVMRTKRFQRE